MRLKILLFLALLPAYSICAETPIPASPASWVTDDAGFMTPESAHNLNNRLAAFEKSSGHQVFVYIGKSTGGVPIEDWAVKAFKKWQVGRKGQDDGVVLFLMVEDRRIRIEVGYGLEGQLTDVLSSRIIKEEIEPRLVSGDHDGAIVSGTEAILKILQVTSSPAAQSNGRTVISSSPMSAWQMIMYGLIGLALLAFAATHPSLSMYLLINILSAGRGRSGVSSSGGGFSGGGGGRSGGGGASGSW